MNHVVTASLMFLGVLTAGLAAAWNDGSGSAHTVVGGSTSWSLGSGSYTGTGGKSDSWKR